MREREGKRRRSGEGQSAALNQESSSTSGRIPERSHVKRGKRQHIPQLSGQATGSQRQTAIIKARVMDFYYFLDIHSHNYLEFHHTVRCLSAVMTAPQVSSIHTQEGGQQITRTNDPREGGLKCKARPFGGAHITATDSLFSALLLTQMRCA